MPHDAIATVEQILRSHEDHGHSYAVQYDDRSLGAAERIIWPAFESADDWLAAAELEPAPAREGE